MKLIIAEDETVSRILLRKVLVELDQDVIAEATNGQEMVDLYIKNKDRVQVIFADIMMPVMNGLEAAREIKKINKNVIIVAVTALDGCTHITDSKNNYVSWTHCDFFIRKPITPSSIKLILDAVHFDLK
jgi:CheY-like chemotaxis protein